MFRNSGLKKGSLPKLGKKETELPKCEVPDDSIYFNFKYLTKKKEHNPEFLNSGNEKLAAKQLLNLLASVSQSSWKELIFKGKTSGGFKTIPISQF